MCQSITEGVNMSEMHIHIIIVIISHWLRLWWMMITARSGPCTMLAPKQWNARSSVFRLPAALVMSSSNRSWASPQQATGSLLWVILLGQNLHFDPSLNCSGMISLSLGNMLKLCLPSSHSSKLTFSLSLTPNTSSCLWPASSESVCACVCIGGGVGRGWCLMMNMWIKYCVLM